MLVETVYPAYEFTRGMVTAFTGIGSVIAGEDRTLGTRVGVGYGTVAGYVIATSSAPGANAGTLHILQSVDGTNWDIDETFAVGPGTTPVSFSVEILARYLRITFEVPATEVYSIRFQAIMKPLVK